MKDDDPRHGTAHGYKTYACRCPRCASAYSVQRYRLRDRLSRVPAEKVPHGTLTGYTNYSCRCNECSTVMASYGRKRTASK